MAVGGFGGLQFQPGVAENSNGNGQRGRVQEPVQVLSTRLPKFFGAQSIAPAMLLQSQGGMGQPAARGNVVAQALAQLAGLPPSMAQPSAPSGGMAPPPSGGSGMFGMPGMSGVSGMPGMPTPGGNDVVTPPSLPPPPPPQPPPTPPPPVIRPGDQPGDNTPPAPLPIGGRLPLPGTVVREDGATFPGGDDLVRLLASGLFR